MQKAKITSKSGPEEKLAHDAPDIIQRLRETTVTITGLMKEYRCAYVTMRKAILSQMSESQYRRLAQKNLARAGRSTRFKPGREPWNAGMKGWCPPGSVATQFKAGEVRGAAARKYRGLGSVTVRRGKLKSGRSNAQRFQSSRWIKISDEGPLVKRYIPLARYLWQRDHGPVPQGEIVIHKDNDSMNDDPANLITVDRRALAIRLRQRPEVEDRRRIRSREATKRRHKQNRAAKQWARIQRMQTRIVYECHHCGADLDGGMNRCPKCGGIAFERREIGNMPESVHEERSEREVLTESFIVNRRS